MANFDIVKKEKHAYKEANLSIQRIDCGLYLTRRVLEIMQVFEADLFPNQRFNRLAAILNEMERDYKSNSKDYSPKVQGDIDHQVL
jgi:hypothetical protein